MYGDSELGGNDPNTANFDLETSSSVPAAVSWLSSASNSIANLFSSKKQREWSEEMMDKQNQWSLDMWNRTNEYNSPSAQVQRLRDAGLNPMYYGLDGSSANSFQSAQPLGYERASFSGNDNPLLMQAEIENIKADIGLKTNQSQTEIDRKLNLRAERDEIVARAKNYLASANLSDSERKKIEQYMRYAEDIYQSQIDRDNSIAQLNQADKNRIDKLLPGELELQKMNISDFLHKWKKWNAEIAHFAKEDAVLAKQAKYYLIDKLDSGVMGSGISAKNTYLLFEILNDPDLSSKDKATISEAFGLDQHDDSLKPTESDKTLFDGKISQNADPSGNYFGATF